MNARAAAWPIILADLSLILFVTTLAGLDQIERRSIDAGTANRHTAPAAPGQALYRAAPGAMPFDEWLKLEARDPRARLSIHLRFPPGRQDEAWRSASEFAAQARQAGIDPRIVLEQGTAFEARATLAYDDPQWARSAASQAQTTRSRPSSLAR